MKVWITKYALTEGIQEIEADDRSGGDGMVKRIDADWGPYFHGEGKEWHRSRDAAVVRAEAMRQAKIKSVKKQLERLERMTF